jgi:hypothetical protein
MKNVAFYDSETRIVTATATMHPFLVPDPSGDPWVLIPEGVTLEDPREWQVSVSDELVHVGRPVTVDDLLIERDRRLALGFDYDFTDSRGIHHIGTAPGDMEKWVGEVTPIAQAYLNLGTPSAQIEIQTETGLVSVTALEWQSILAAAMNTRQPVYQGYFTLKTMDPIPVDFAADQYWTISS